MSLQTLPQYETYKDSGIEWLGKIPTHWSIKPLKYLVKINNGIDHKHVLSNDGYPVYGSGGIFAYAKDYLYEGKAILLGRKGTIDKPLFVEGKFWTVDTMFYAVCKKDINEKYVFYIATTIPFKLYSTATALPSMTQADLNSNPVAFPSYSEQTAIAHFLDQKTAQIDAAIAIKEKQIALLKERKQILIQQAVTQGLDPTVPMKDSGVEWIGKIPAHWECTEIRKFARTTSGSTPQSGNVNAYYNGNIPWVRTTDLNDDVLIDVPEKITERALRETSCKLIPENSVCVAMYGGSGTIGKHAILRFSGTLNQAVCGIMPSKKISQEYLYYYVKFYRPHWMIVAKGSRVDPNISQDQVRRMPITLPPLKEQDRIVCFIDSECKKISELIDLEYQQIEKLREYKTTLINSAVTGKIRVTPEMVAAAA